MHNRCLSQTTCFSYLNTDHIRKRYPTRSKAPNCEFEKGKVKADVEHIRGEMNKTWKKKDGCSTSNGARSHHLIGQVVTPHQTKKIRGMRN